ncbi:unnamed protein product [Tilletia laevis]|uniref:Uncharacterized protein n=1 Tax=Tilletia caries TaxID=13290 RepID=A0A8T8SUD0_9BASI|nr:hypothetical protein CF335_g6797 [Tilletia laevis]KAE8194661.1 hypothetical protein CF328_g4671 [Tilletia controversa]KAE8248478.1 hypothetical protein A4X03_0g6768 [Tilletia caries]KAE8191068.1 hypothetical protein CF336_g5028 [Tilletia laevis]CAD6904611.1 unnamed protein product [Tilletia caries]
MIAGSLPQYSAGAISPVPAQSLSSLADDGHMDMVSTDLVRTGVTFLLVYNYLGEYSLQPAAPASAKRDLNHAKFVLARSYDH